MAANWAEIATGQLLTKIAIGLILFLPAYGALLRYLNGKLSDNDEEQQEQ